MARPRGANYIANKTECKYFDSYRAQVALNAPTNDWSNTEYDPATANCLFAPTMGTAFNNRVGRKCWIKNIKIRGQITVDMGTADSPTCVRIIVYRDKQTNGTFAQGENVIGMGGAIPAPAAINAMNMFLNPDNFTRFEILKDKVIVIRDTNNAVGGAAGEYAVHNFKIKINKYCEVEFNAGNTGTVSDIINNSFHVIAMANGIAGAPKIQYFCRVSFKDQ